MSDREIAVAWCVISGGVVALAFAVSFFVYFRGAPRFGGLGWYAPATVALSFLFVLGGLAIPLMATTGMMSIDDQAYWKSATTAVSLYDEAAVAAPCDVLSLTQPPQIPQGYDAAHVLP